jgi:hypothetical protein
MYKQLILLNRSFIVEKAKFATQALEPVGVNCIEKHELADRTGVQYQKFATALRNKQLRAFLPSVITQNRPMKVT